MICRKCYAAPNFMFKASKTFSKNVSLYSRKNSSHTTCWSKDNRRKLVFLRRMISKSSSKYLQKVKVLRWRKFSTALTSMFNVCKTFFMYVSLHSKNKKWSHTRCKKKSMSYLENSSLKMILVWICTKMRSGTQCSKSFSKTGFQNMTLISYSNNTWDFHFKSFSPFKSFLLPLLTNTSNISRLKFCPESQNLKSPKVG